MPNEVLNVIVVASAALRVLTVTFPPLRTLLGLAPISLSVAGFVVGALIPTVVAAETWSRRAARSRTAE